jgi:serine/threonine protein kinase
VVEACEGVSLEFAFELERNFSLPETLEIALQAGRGLAAAHQLGLLHLDFGPGSVTISDDLEVKVGGIGLAQIAHAALQGRTGVVVGNARYMSPEQLTASACDARSDVYSFGILLYRLACGREPFIDGGDFAIARHHYFQPPPAPEKFNPQVSPELSRIILKSLSKAPADRYPDMQSMLEDLARERGAPPVPRDPATVPLGAVPYLRMLGKLMGERLWHMGTDAPPIVILVDGILRLALSRDCDEILFEPRQPRNLDVRLRAGDVWTSLPPVKDDASAVSRLLVVGHLEKGKDARSRPQAGRAVIHGLPMIFTSEPVENCVERIRIRIEWNGGSLSPD